MLTRSEYLLPRKLKRPYFTFFLVVTLVYVLAVVASAFVAILSGSSGVLVLTAIMGGALWFGFFMGVLFNWQSLTVFEDHLIFNSFGKKTTVFYREIDKVEAAAVEVGTGMGAVPTLTLYLHHRAEGKTPLVMNLKLLGAKERVLLLELLKEGAPTAQLNAQAEQMRQGK